MDASIYSLAALPTRKKYRTPVDTHFAMLDHDYESDTNHAFFRQYDNTQ